MKVLFFTPTNIYSNLAEIELELMQRHLDVNDEVNTIVCNGNLKFCEINPNHKLIQCLYCQSKRKKSFIHLTGNIHIHNLDDYYPLVRISKDPKIKFNNISELKDYKWDNYFDVGYSIGSYLISEKRDPNLDIKPYEAAIETLIKTSIHLYEATRLFLQMNKIEKVYVWNGRMPTMRPIIRAATAEKINFATYNVGHNVNHFETFDNALIHDLTPTANKIINYWWASSLTPENKNHIASDFYISRTLKKNTNTESRNRFLEFQDEEKLPGNWDDSKINVAIFNSSEDELASISDEWKNSIYKDQFDGLNQLLNSIENNDAFKHYHFYLRIHPNLVDVDNSDLRNQLSLISSQLTIIPANSKVSTYLLIEKCNVVVSFGSTAGIEAVFMNKPSILLGNSFYKNLPGGTYQPKSHDEFVQLLASNLAPLDKTGAMMYGHFWKVFGTPLKYATIENGMYYFKNKILRAHPFYEFLKFVKSMIKK